MTCIFNNTVIAELKPEKQNLKDSKSSDYKIEQKVPEYKAKTKTRERRKKNN